MQKNIHNTRSDHKFGIRKICAVTCLVLLTMHVTVFADTEVNNLFLDELSVFNTQDTDNDVFWPGRHIFIAISGTSLSSSAAEFIRTQKPSGIILLGDNIRDKGQTQLLVKKIKEAAGMGTGIADFPLIAIDQEGGSVNRLKIANAPSAQQLGIENDLYKAEAIGKYYAAECYKRNIAIVLAPVLDMYVAGNNTFLKKRSFGNEPGRVAALGLSFAKGLQDGGVVPVVKHFPGHGATKQDSHKSLAILQQEGAELERTLSPFKEAIHQLVPAVMTGHIRCLALDEAGLPATLSYNMIHALIRNEWQYNGVIITDDLNMGAIQDSYTIEDAAVKALVAGNDAIIVCETNVKKLTSICNAISKAEQQGVLSHEQLKNSWKRIKTIQAWLQAKAETITPDEIEPDASFAANDLSCEKNKSHKISTVNAGKASSATGSRIYMIKEGDTLFKIAQKYDAAVADICSLNNLTNPDQIKVGSILMLP